CEVFVHIDKDDRNKLEDKSKKCSFVGYGEYEFGFYVWTIKDKKLFQSRDIFFNENVMYKVQLHEQKEESKKEYTMLEDIADNKVSKGLI
ncbi:hypothetical protein KI387_017899, partial [Taxus chinensis]